MKNRFPEMVGKLVMARREETLYNKYYAFGRTVVGNEYFCVGYEKDLTIIYDEKLVSVAPRTVVCLLQREFLAGKKFCLTGGGGQDKKSEIKAIIEGLGGEVVKSPRHATIILQGRIEKSLKLAYAESHNIPVMNYSEFNNLVAEAMIGGFKLSQA